MGHLLQHQIQGDSPLPSLSAGVEVVRSNDLTKYVGLPVEGLRTRVRSKVAFTRKGKVTADAPGSIRRGWRSNAGRNGAHIGETSNRLAKDGVATPRGRKKANFRPAL